MTLLGGYYYSHFTSEETESCRGIFLKQEIDPSRAGHEQKDPSGRGLEGLFFHLGGAGENQWAGRPGNRDSKIEAGFPWMGVGLWSLE